MNIKDRVAIVTGASSGIGLATAKLLTKSGAKVALVARSDNKLKNISKDLKNSFVVVCDMEKQDQVEDMIDKVKKHYRKIDILVNNAGVGYDTPIEKIDIDTFRKVINLDLIGSVVAIKKVIPIMKKQGAGAIVNISSGTALMDLPNMSGYSSIKKALAQISTTASKELKKDFISVSVVYPYITDTDFEKNTIKEEFEAQWEGDSDIPEPDSPDHVAKIIIQAIKEGKEVYYAHDWMARRTNS